MTRHQSAGAIVADLKAEYERSIGALKAALKAFLETGAPPDPAARRAGGFAYPELVLSYSPTVPPPRLARSYARFSQPGTYAVTITRPDLFEPYLTEQLGLLMADFEVSARVRRSSQEIPFPYVLDASDMAVADVTASQIARLFPATELAFIGDEVADGFWAGGPDEPRPLALFDALRTDFSLARLTHYTGAPAEHTQAYVLFTNYHRYVDEFVRWAAS